MKEEAFTGELVEALSRKGYDASPAYCIRNNGGKAVLAFHGASPYSPAFDTGPLVERYRKGMPVGEIAGRLADRLEQASAAGRMLRYLQPGAARYREIRQNLRLCMVRREGNTEFLSETPHRSHGDFAAVVCWAADGTVEASMVMGKEALDGLGTGFDRAFRDAYINMMGEFELKSMEEMLYETVAGKLETRQMRDIPADRYIRKIQERVVCYDIKKMQKNMWDAVMLIIQDHIWGRVAKKRTLKKGTWVNIDEYYLLLRKPITAAYCVEMWKRFRKWGGIPTGITQNVKDLFRSPGNLEHTGYHGLHPDSEPGGG